MKKAAIFVYGVVSYLIFFACFLYLIGFVSNGLVPKSIDSGETGPVGLAILINLGLMILFGLQHSIMARRSFKAQWTKIVPKAAERSTYVLMSSLVLILIYWQWRPLPQILWNVGDPIGRVAIWALAGVGVCLILLSSFLIDHFELFGLQQPYLHLRNRQKQAIPFRTPWLYRIVRHPLHLGTTTLLWATPQMSVGHLFFAAVMTAYIVIGIYFEERDLVRHFGPVYEEYQRTTPMLVPGSRRSPKRQQPQPSTGD